MPFHLLIVDDEAHSRKLLRMVLRQGDYAFTEAESGQEALGIMEAVAEHEHRLEAALRS